MKNIFTLMLVVFSLNTWAQTEKQANIYDIMALRNGDAIFNRLINSSVANIAPEKQAEFRSKAEKLATDKKKEAYQYFEKKYSQVQLNRIYSELAIEDQINLSEESVGFIREWRSYKAQFQTEMKKLIYSYQ